MDTPNTDIPNEDEDEIYDFPAMPLKETLRCKVCSASTGEQCTNSADWQVGVWRMPISDRSLKRWEPTCYDHMAAYIEEYKKQRSWEEENSRRLHYERIPTKKLTD